MKWFKHISDSGDDPDIDDAITLFGYKANYIFWRVLELMAREFNINNPGKNTFSLSFFKSKLRTNWGPTSEVLEFYQTRHRIYFELFNNNGLRSIRLNCPKLKELCDEYTQKLLKENRETVPTEIGSDSDIEVEEEVKEDKDPKKELFQLPNKEEINESSMPKIKEDIEEICDYLYETKKFPKVHAFKNKMLKEEKYERAILHTLVRCALKDNFEDTPWAYCKKIIEVENGNYIEYEYGKDKG